jgi:hypothetical protein
MGKVVESRRGNVSEAPGVQRQNIPQAPDEEGMAMHVGLEMVAPHVACMLHERVAGGAASRGGTQHPKF